jgi:hypothetical protein
MGHPLDIATITDSHTARYLREALRATAASTGG